MIYPYMVKHNGVWYPAGADVPVGTTTSVEPKTETVDEQEAEKAFYTETKRRGRPSRKK